MDWDRPRLALRVRRRAREDPSVRTGPAGCLAPGGCETAGQSGECLIVRAFGVEAELELLRDSPSALFATARPRCAEVLARLDRGEDVDASEYTFRTSTQIETASARLDWLNNGVFISAAGRRQGGVVYETYLVA
jgi:hypothetical protein